MRKLLVLAVALVAALAVASPVFAQETKATQDRAVTASGDWPVRAHGDRGADVRSIQYLLRARGYADFTATGYFGDLTRDAVEKFQKDEGLKVSGVVRDRTWEALVKPLASGSSGDAVRALQVQLANNGYDVPVTGYFGRTTRGAIKSFQEDRGVRITGKANQETWRQLVNGPYHTS